MHTVAPISPTRTSPPDRHRSLDRDHSINLRVLLEVDTVGLLVRRYGIAPETARAHVDAFNLGGSR